MNAKPSNDDEEEIVLTQIEVSSHAKSWIFSLGLLSLHLKTSKRATRFLQRKRRFSAFGHSNLFSEPGFSRISKALFFLK